MQQYDANFGIGALAETDAQVERLNEVLWLLGSTARAKPCKGMAGLIEEGQEVIRESKEKADAAADLALIGAAMRVERGIWLCSCTGRRSCSY